MLHDAELKNTVPVTAVPKAATHTTSTTPNTGLMPSTLLAMVFSQFWLVLLVGQGKEELHSYTAGCLSSVAVAMIGSAEGGGGGIQINHKLHYFKELIQRIFHYSKLCSFTPPSWKMTRMEAVEFKSISENQRLHFLFPQASDFKRYTFLAHHYHLPSPSPIGLSWGELFLAISLITVSQDWWHLKWARADNNFSSWAQLGGCWWPS